MDWAVKLTRQPWAMTREDADGLRGLGWTDREIVDACEVVSYFNYINRIADGLGVDLEASMPEKPADFGPPDLPAPDA